MILHLSIPLLHEILISNNFVENGGNGTGAYIIRNRSFTDWFPAFNCHTDSFNLSYRISQTRFHDINPKPILEKRIDEFTSEEFMRAIIGVLEDANSEHINGAEPPVADVDPWHGAEMSIEQSNRFLRDIANAANVPPSFLGVTPDDVSEIQAVPLADAGDATAQTIFTSTPNRNGRIFHGDTIRLETPISGNERLTLSVPDSDGTIRAIDATTLIRNSLTLRNDTLSEIHVRQMLQHIRNSIEESIENRIGTVVNDDTREEIAADVSQQLSHYLETIGISLDGYEHFSENNESSRNQRRES